MWAKVLDMSHLFVCIVALVIQGAVVLWPNFGHCTTVTTINVWERIGEK